MKIEINFDCKHIKWKTISETLKSVGMAYYSPEKHKKAWK